jgi:Skp family chaperone for outer membrane proteins
VAAQRPIVPAGVPEKFMAAAGNQGVEYEPHVGARVRAHFVDARAGVDAWESWYYLAPLTARGPAWDDAEVSSTDAIQLLDAPAANATFAEVPASALAAKAFAQHGKSLADHIYRTCSLSVMRCPELKLTSVPGGSESEFRAQIAQALREKRDAAVDALRAKYGAKLNTLADRARRAEQKLTREKAQASQQTMSSALSVGGSLLGALFGGGRRSSMITKASSAARSVGRIGKERTDISHAEADLEALQQQHAALEAQLADEVAALEARFDASAIPVESAAIRARKSDTEVTDVALVWRPA